MRNNQGSSLLASQESTTGKKAHMTAEQELGLTWRKSSLSDTGGCGEMAWRKSSFSGASGGGCVEMAWHKSSFSGGGGGGCVEVAWPDLQVAVRDSKNPGGPSLTFPQANWSACLRSAADA